jgi:hypothetical protein
VTVPEGGDDGHDGRGLGGVALKTADPQGNPVRSTNRPTSISSPAPTPRPIRVWHLQVPAGPMIARFCCARIHSRLGRESNTLSLIEEAATSKDFNLRDGADARAGSATGCYPGPDVLNQRERQTTWVV